MSADSQQQGLAESQDMTRFKSFEDPALSWIDLVAALKCGDPAVARACMQIAKDSNWTHAIYEEECAALDEEDDPEWTSGTELLMGAEKLRSLKQTDIDDFFEE